MFALYSCSGMFWHELSFFSFSTVTPFALKSWILPCLHNTAIMPFKFKLESFLSVFSTCLYKPMYFSKWSRMAPGQQSLLAEDMPLVLDKSRLVNFTVGIFFPPWWELSFPFVFWGFLAPFWDLMEKFWIVLGCCLQDPCKAIWTRLDKQAFRSVTLLLRLFWQQFQRAECHKCSYNPMTEHLCVLAVVNVTWSTASTDACTIYGMFIACACWHSYWCESPCSLE